VAARVAIDKKIEDRERHHVLVDTDGRPLVPATYGERT